MEYKASWRGSFALECVFVFISYHKCSVLVYLEDRKLE
jgi:hypothetical protein